MFGVTRNLTSRFVQLREQSFHGQVRHPVGASSAGEGRRREDERRLLSDGYGRGAVGGTHPPPAWVALCEELQESMERIQQKTGELRKMHRQHLLPGFDDDNRVLEQQRIDAFAREIAQSLRQCDVNVKRISGSENLAAQEARVRSNARTSLATRLHELSRNYRKEQDNFMAKLEQQNGGAPTNQIADPFEVYGGDDIHEQGQQARSLLSSNEQEIRFRDGQITQVARSVQEIATLMQDLSELVIDQVCSCAAFLLQFGRYEHILSQGTKFDRIDYNIEQTVHDTAQAVKQLAKAEQSQKKGRLMNCILCLLVMCAAMTVVILLRVIV